MTRALAVVACVLLFVEGTDGKVQQPEKQTSPVGAWDLTARDKAGFKYIATLILTTDDSGKLVGHITWSGSDGSTGREHIACTYDPKGRILTLKGVKLEYGKGLSLGTYRAELTTDGTELKKGTFQGSQPMFDGEWEAKRIVFK